MLRSCLRALATFSLLAGAAVATWATPSSIVLIPSTDVREPGQNHLDFDGYFTFDSPAASPVTVLGYSRGFPGRFEAGVDHIGSSRDPFLLHAKWQALAPREGRAPVAVAVGAYNWGGSDNPLAGNLLYGLASYTLPQAGRFSLGYQHGQKSRVGEDNNMLLLAWEKQLNPKWWAAIDYASGDSGFGAISPGVAYTFAPNTSVLFGYDFYNNGALKDTITVQVDINF